MRSTSTKKPLPLESFSLRESKVSIATADGLMRRTSSGRRSCACVGMGRSRTSKIQTSFISGKGFTSIYENLRIDTKIRSILFQRSTDVSDFNIFALLCAPLEQFNYAVSDFFPDRDSIR